MRFLGTCGSVSLNLYCGPDTDQVPHHCPMAVSPCGKHHGTLLFPFEIQDQTYSCILVRNPNKMLCMWVSVRQREDRRCADLMGFVLCCWGHCCVEFQGVLLTFQYSLNGAKVQDRSHNLASVISSLFFSLLPLTPLSFVFFPHVSLSAN